MVLPIVVAAKAVHAATGEEILSVTAFPCGDGVLSFAVVTGGGRRIAARFLQESAGFLWETGREPTRFRYDSEKGTVVLGES